MQTQSNLHTNLGCLFVLFHYKIRREELEGWDRARQAATCIKEAGPVELPSRVHILDVYLGIRGWAGICGKELISDGKLVPILF